MSKPDIDGGPPVRHRFLRTAPVDSPLGRLLVAGALAPGRGVEPFGQLRRYGSHALIMIAAGHGTYRDERGRTAELGPGDAVLVFPGLAHWYGPDVGERWEEWYVTFDGPAFDLLRAGGVLDPDHPVSRPGPVFEQHASSVVGPSASRARRRSTPVASPTAQVAAVLALLADLAATRYAVHDERRPGWLEFATLLLDGDLDRQRSVEDVAAAVHVHPDTLRRAFRASVGESPARYRSRRRVESAEQLLRFSPELTNRELAAMLGFADEFHFSHRFRQLTGRSPRSVRQEVRGSDAAAATG